MRPALTAFFLLALAAPAVAADKAGAPGTNVDMPYLMAPMTGADGKLSGYAYISSRLTATSDVFALAVRDKLAFIQDAFVRDVNGAEITKPDDPDTVDQSALASRLLADAKRVMGPGKVVSIALVQVQIASLHPTQTAAPSTLPASDNSAATAARTAASGD